MEILFRSDYEFYGFVHDIPNETRNECLNDNKYNFNCNNSICNNEHDIQQ